MGEYAEPVAPHGDSGVSAAIGQHPARAWYSWEAHGESPVALIRISCGRADDAINELVADALAAAPAPPEKSPELLMGQPLDQIGKASRQRGRMTVIVHDRDGYGVGLNPCDDAHGEWVGGWMVAEPVAPRAAEPVAPQRSETGLRSHP